MPLAAAASYGAFRPIRPRAEFGTLVRVAVFAFGRVAVAAKQIVSGGFVAIREGANAIAIALTATTSD